MYLIGGMTKILQEYRTNNFQGLPDQYVPKEFNPINILPPKIDKFSTWDKFHCKVQSGSDQGQFISSGKKETYRFKCNKNGKLDYKNGTYIEEPITQTKWKYRDEVRLFLGVTVVSLFILKKHSLVLAITNKRWSSE